MFGVFEQELLFGGLRHRWNFFPSTHPVRADAELWIEKCSIKPSTTLSIVALKVDDHYSGI